MIRDFTLQIDDERSTWNGGDIARTWATKTGGARETYEWIVLDVDRASIGRPVLVVVLLKEQEG